MGAPLGFKTFATGDVLTAADTNGYLMQGVWAFANAAARTAAVTSPQQGNMSFLKDTNSTEYYNGSAWVAVAGSSTPTAVGAEVFRTSTQSLSAATLTAVSWSSAGTNTNTIWSAGSPTRFTIPSGKGGVYCVTTSLTFNNASGQVQLYVYKNGSAVSNMSYVTALNASNINGGSMTAILTLAAADYIEIYVNSNNAAQIVSGVSSGSIFYLGA